MRTTVDIPEELHHQLMSIARDTSRSFSETTVDIIRRGLGTGEPLRISYDPETHLPLFHVGHPITTEDVRSLEDDQ
jgi:hypothetical protein